MESRDYFCDFSDTVSSENEDESVKSTLPKTLFLGGFAVNRKPNYGRLVSANTMNWRE